MKLIFRKASIDDLSEIVRLLAQDELGKLRESCVEPLPEEYKAAFKNIENDPNQELVVVENEVHDIVGTMQLTFLQYLTYKGGIRAQIEAVRIDERFRGKGAGTQMFTWAIARAKERGAHILQLTTDKKRPQAICFYESLGFAASHEGMKLHIPLS